MICSGLLAQANGPFFETVLIDELPSRTINCLAKDEMGAMWVGTPNGLARVIGDHVRVWQQRPGDTTSLIANMVLTVDATDPKRVWVGTSRGLCALDPVSGTIQRFPCQLPGLERAKANTARQVVRTDARSLWVATAADLLYFDIQRGAWAVPGARLRNRPNQRIPAVPGAMAYDDQRRLLWLGTKEGLYVLDSAMLRAPMKPYDLDLFEVSTTVMCITLDEEGRPVIHDAQRLSLTTIDPDARGTQYADLPPRTDPWSIGMAMIMDRSGVVWLSTSDERLYKGSRETGIWTTIGHEPDVPWSLPKVKVKAMLLDANGTVWLGTNGGLVRSVEETSGHRLICTWREPMSVNRMRYHNGKLYLGTHGAGMITLDPNVPQKRDTLVHANSARRSDPAAPGQLSDIINDLLPLDDGGGLLATGIGVMHWEAGWSTYGSDTMRVPRTSDLSRRSILALASDADGTPWVLSMFHGLWRLAGQHGTPDSTEAHRIFEGTLPDGRELAHPTSLIPDAHHGVWCGTSSGHLLRFSANEPDPWVTTVSDSASLASIEALAVTSDGRVWAGCDDGTYGSLQGRSAYEHAGTVGDRIIDMQGSGDRLWILSDGGTWLVDTRSAVHAKHQRLAPHWGRPSALAPDGLGGTYVAFTRAIMHVDGTNNVANRLAPVPVIAAVLHNISYLPVDPSRPTLATSYDRRALRILITAIGTTTPELVRFRYRLDAASPWLDLGRSRSLDLPDLWEGRYRIEIVALDESGRPGKASAVLDLTIEPPWYRSPAVIAIAVLLLVLTIVIFVRQLLRRRVRTERQRAEREQELLKERIRIAQDLHDDLGSSLALISMESEMARMDVRDNHAREALRKVGEGARDVTDNMRRIVWALGSGQDTLGDLVAYIRSSAAELLDRAGIDLETHLDISEPSLKLSVDQRRHLLLISKEMLLNAVKHAGASAVTIRMDHRDGSFRIGVSDNGKGYDPEQVSGLGTGTVSMRQRALALDGELRVRSAPGAGTTIEAVVPLRPGEV